ncbi:4-coumarate-CoA ligase, variant [Exophiala viscosa]|uniref:4-coumarate-CoA ligase, variant n=1 Tax=Exophiala viscosa TaxID=2486360 RepID=A0AAN6IBF0_9EURO|nr:4-coumarate-CoA ligase, variant [Exophiala viscosa]
MIFNAPDFLPPLPEVPDNVPLCDFMFDEQYGRRPISQSLDAYTCGITGRSISAEDQKSRVSFLARSLANELGWKVNVGSEYDKVVGVFAHNTIDIMTVNWAIHRVNGISSPANAVYSVDELKYQLSFSNCKALFTVMSLLPVALEAAAKSGLPKNRIYICEMPGDGSVPADYKTISQLIKDGQRLPDLEQIRWSAGQGARQTAFLCYSSGTSGLPKAVMISHHNVIANTIQSCLFEKGSRDKISPDYRDVALGLLPQSHIYGLVLIGHASTYRGDQVIVLPKFETQTYLKAIAKYRINTLYLVPPIILMMAKNEELLNKFDLASVREIYSGAAPLAREILQELTRRYPAWKIRQAYGLTECSPLVTATISEDVWPGSSGSLIPGCAIKLVNDDGNEVTGYDEAGEVLVRSPAVVLGYLKNEKATNETFIDLPDGRFLRTGDKGEIRISPESGVEHLWIVDRIKELIKVKGHQVAPAELEAYLLDHPAVADCAVISVPDEAAGEAPKAFVVLSPSASLGSDSKETIARSIQQYVEKGKARYKWISGGIQFVDVIPKSASGKILRRLLRDSEREKRRAAGAKI